MKPKKTSTRHKLVAQSKQAFTLIEVMVALTLVSILLTVGFGAYSQMSVLERVGDQFRHAALQQRLAQTRLASLFLRIPEPNDFSKKELKKLPSRIFYSSNRSQPGLFRPGSLVFTYDNQTDLRPEFCNDVIARLYVKEPTGQNGETQGALWLTTWPRPACSTDPSLARHELLLEGVKQISFRFYALPEETKDQSLPPVVSPSAAKAGAPGPGEAAPQPAPTPNDWNNTWLMSYSQLPAIVHLTLDMEDINDKKVDPLDFYFPLIVKPPPLFGDN